MENKELTPAQALELIYKVTGSLQLSRPDHQTIEQALHTLAALLPAQKN
jgi:hypothetical protein